MWRERGCLLKKNFVCVCVLGNIGRWMVVLQVFCLLHMRMNTQIRSKKKKTLRAKERMGNKAACVIELGKGLPTISQLSNKQSL